MSGAVAAIDCGTNTIRLLVARRDGSEGPLTELAREMDVVRLGYGVDRTGRFDPAAIERTLAVTRRYRRIMAEHGVDTARFVATSATRDARNREDFIDGVHRILGIDPEVVAGQEEAALSFSGAVSTLPGTVPGPRLVVDIGGGSTELVLGDQEPAARTSLDIGSVRLTERHLHDDPPSAAQIAATKTEIDAQLDRAAQVIPFADTRSLIGVAGTVTTLTALAEGLTSYTPSRTHGSSRPLSEFRALCEEVVAMSVDERRATGSIEPGRVDVIGAGALIWERVMARVAGTSPVEDAVTSEHDILDGIALGLL